METTTAASETFNSLGSAFTVSVTLLDVYPVALTLKVYVPAVTPVNEYEPSSPVVSRNVAAPPPVPRSVTTAPAIIFALPAESTLPATDDFTGAGTGTMRISRPEVSLPESTMVSDLVV